MLVGKSFARQKFDAMIASSSTERLRYILNALNLDTSSEAILVCSQVAVELEKRLPEPEFLELMHELDTELTESIAESITIFHDLGVPA